MANRKYSEETKAAAMAALLQGQSVSSVAKEYKIPKGTISGWKVKAHEAKDGVGMKATQKSEIGDLLVDYLKANLIALKAQSEQFADKEWLSNQEADSAAVLHGVMTDKAIRLLEAFGADDSNTQAED